MDGCTGIRFIIYFIKFIYYWHYVIGIISGHPLPHNDGELTIRVRGLTDKTTQRFRCRRYYTKIGRVKQKEDESFEEYRIRMTTVFKAHSGLEETQSKDQKMQYVVGSANIT